MACGAKKKNINELHSENEKLHEKVAALESSLSHVKESNGELKKQLGIKRRELHDVSQQQQRLLDQAEAFENEAKAQHDALEGLQSRHSKDQQHCTNLERCSKHLAANLVCVQKEAQHHAR